MKLIIVLGLCLLSSCQDYNSNSSDASRYADLDLPPGSSDEFVASYTILRNDCFRCHSTWQEYKTEQDWIDAGLVVKNDSDSSSLITRMKNYSPPGDMPTDAGPINDADYDTLVDWIVNMP